MYTNFTKLNFIDIVDNSIYLQILLYGVLFTFVLIISYLIYKFWRKKTRQQSPDKDTIDTESLNSTGNEIYNDNSERNRSYHKRNISPSLLPSSIIDIKEVNNEIQQDSFHSEQSLTEHDFSSNSIQIPVNISSTLSTQSIKKSSVSELENSHSNISSKFEINNQPSDSIEHEILNVDNSSKNNREGIKKSSISAIFPSSSVLNKNEKPQRKDAHSFSFFKNIVRKTKPKLYGSHNDASELQGTYNENNYDRLQPLSLLSQNINQTTKSSDTKDTIPSETLFKKTIKSSLEKLKQKEKYQSAQSVDMNNDIMKQNIIDSQEFYRSKSERKSTNDENTTTFHHSSPVLTQVDELVQKSPEIDTRLHHSLTKVTEEMDDVSLQPHSGQIENFHPNESIEIRSEHSSDSIHRTIPVVIKYFASWNKTGKVLNITIVSVVGMNDLINYVGWKSLKVKIKEYPRKLYHFSTKWKPLSRPFFNNNFTFYHMEEDKLAETDIIVSLYAKKSFGRGFLVGSTTIHLKDIDLTSVLCDDIKRISMNIDVKHN